MSNSSPLKIIPLGGLGEFGLNCTIFESEDEAICVDCGVMFPDNHMPGVDVVVPDLTYLRELGEKFLGFVFTHGHEDHIGAVPHILGDFDVPMWATRFTAGLIERKLDEVPALSDREVTVYEPRIPFRVGKFEIEGIHVTHSIADACALAIRHEDQLLVHSGDFKIDPEPVDGWSTDTDRLKELGDEGVSLLLADSTNVESPGTSGSESLVRGYLEPLFEEATGRIFVTTFSSHVHRLAAVVSLCEQFGRRLVLMGRSMENISSLATRTGDLRIPGSMLLSPKQASHLPPEELCYLVAGCQGESRAALSRIVAGSVRAVQAGPGDIVIFSSKVIPGNERAISALIDDLYRAGIEVHYPRLRPLHVSGHGYREELRTMLDLVRPKFFLPVHGHFHNLVHHARLGVETGIPEDRCFTLNNGGVLRLDGDTCVEDTRVQAGRVMVDWDVAGGADEDVLRDRRNIARDGVVMVVMTVSPETGEIVQGPDLVPRGLVAEGLDIVSLEDAAAAVARHVRGLDTEAWSDVEGLGEEVRVATRRYFRRTLGSRPVVVPFITGL